MYGGGDLACDKCRIVLKQWQLLPWGTMEKVGMGWIGNTCGFQREIILLSVSPALGIENSCSCFQHGSQIWNDLSKSSLIKMSLECF